MKNAKTLNRREFTLAAAMAALSGVAITISACSGARDASPSAPSATGERAGVIGDNHSHAAVITSGQLSAGGALNLNIRGASDHPHTVTLTAAEMTTIAGNSRVSKQSTTDDGHSHSVTFN